MGFAITSQTLARKLSLALGPWAVNGPTMAIAAKAFADTDWTAKTHLRLKEDATQLDSIITPRLGIMLGGTNLFRLYEIADANMYIKLASKGILTRAFADKPKTLRFGLPAKKKDFERLERAIS